MKYCPRCGRPIRTNAAVCPYCGAPQRLRDRADVRQPNPGVDPDDQGWRREDRQPEGYRIKYSRARLTMIDAVMMILNGLNAIILLFLGFQGVIRPYYINNMGIFTIVILSLLGVASAAVEIYQNYRNRLPNWSPIVAMIGDFSAFFLIFMFNQQLFLISCVIIIISLLISYRALRKTY